MAPGLTARGQGRMAFTSGLAGGFAANGSLPVYLPLSLLTFLVMMAAYHGIGFLFELSDRNGWLKSSKVRNIDRLSYAEMMPRILANQVFVLLPSMLFLQWVGLAFTGPEHLSPIRFILSMIAMGIGHDIVQYIAHRGILHRPKLMKLLGHAVHHSTGASKSVSACYMSYPDFFLEITLPYLIPLVVIGGGGSDIFFQFLVAGLGAFGGLYEHSGYDFAAPFRKTQFYQRLPGFAKAIEGLITSHAHAEHHRRFNVSFSDGFGSPGICDTLFGTRWDKAKVK
jgi:sterol desaturase/sphingolipid hydroxylase (fatty acid hydroxylase superfamily)